MNFHNGPVICHLLKTNLTNMEKFLTNYKLLLRNANSHTSLEKFTDQAKLPKSLNFTNQLKANLFLEKNPSYASMCKKWMKIIPNK